MSYADWKDKVNDFKKVDVRGVAGNFLEGLKKQAASLPAGQGIEVIQTFEPIPLYEVMDILGYEHQTERQQTMNIMPIFTEPKKREVLRKSLRDRRSLQTIL